MALPSWNIVNPNQRNSAGDTLALVIPEFTGTVEGTIQRMSVTQPVINVRQVRNTATATNYGVGAATLQKLTAGTVPDGSGFDVSNVAVTIDTTVLARNVVPQLDAFQTQFDVRREIGSEQGKKIAKFKDEAIFIQALKAANLTTSPYGSSGHLGGSKITLANAADALDAALLYQAIVDMIAAQAQKDVVAQREGIMIFLRPEYFYTLTQSEYVVNGQYITSEGNSVNVPVLRALGVPLVMSNDVPNTNITGHYLSNSRNSNAYDGNFTKAVAVAFNSRALLAGSTIDLDTKVWFDDDAKVWKIDSWLAFGITPNRPEFSACIYKP